MLYSGEDPEKAPALTALHLLCCPEGDVAGAIKAAVTMDEGVRMTKVIAPWSLNSALIAP
jgi:hypothetical protein